MFTGIKNLSSTSFNEIINCFFLAFENYFVEFPNDKTLFKKRWDMSNIDYSLSYGMFDRDKLVGFILHGVEHREHHLTAFNLATGVIPEYRGKKITQQLYEFALPELKKKGITKCKLEVIKENKYAISAYKSIGYNIVKSFKCFGGELKIQEDVPYEIVEINIQDFDFRAVTNQHRYSWENQIETLRRGDFKCYQILHNDQIESIFIMDDQNGYVAQFDILIENAKAWERLFSAIHKVSKKVKINNINEQLIKKIKEVEKFGLINTIDQYEMEMILN